MDINITAVSFLVIFSLVLSCNADINGYPFEYEDDLSCHGRYCGRMSRSKDSPCGACPRGYAPDADSMCQRCEGNLDFYDWLYLSFMAMLSLILHWTCIDMLSSPKKTVLLLHTSAFIETLLAVILTLLLSEPMGSFKVRACPVQRFSDWYTMFFNPTPDYADTVYCTQEIVYPLYTMVLIYYTLSLLLMMTFRPWLCYRLSSVQGSRSIYAALYFLPILIVIHSVFGGIIYYTFPYITVVMSLFTNAWHLATADDQRMLALLRHSFTNIRSFVVLMGHFLLHMFGIASITRLENPTLHYPLFILSPFPTFFYIFTVRYTDPDLIFPIKTRDL